MFEMCFFFMKKCCFMEKNHKNDLLEDMIYHFGVHVTYETLADDVIWSQISPIYIFILVLFFLLMQIAYVYLSFSTN